MGSRLKAWSFRLIPHHAVSRATYWFARRRGPWVAALIRWFVRRFGVDLSEAQRPDPGAYATFNDFFVRALRPGARPIEGDEDTVVSPADGRIHGLGTLGPGALLQAKGMGFTTTRLLGGDPRDARPFEHGAWCTVYLSPRDYHRVHMPCSGRLRRMVHVPGRLYTVAPYATRHIPGLFARNERVVCLFDTAHGPMAVVLVGAINVAAIDTVWAGPVTPAPRGAIGRWDYGEAGPCLARGEELGRFNMGSTVIVLLSAPVRWDPALGPGRPVRMGQALGVCPI
jgi:phosphatidylserine decarboxylase